MFKQQELVRYIHRTSQPSVTWTVNNDLNAVGKSLTSYFPSVLYENEGSAKRRKPPLQELMRDAVTLVDQAQQLINSQITQLMSSWIQLIKSVLNFKKETCCGRVELYKVRILACQSCASLPPKYLSTCLTEDSKPDTILGTRRLSVLPASVHNRNRSQPVQCRLSPHKSYCLIVSLDFLGLKVSVLLNVLLV